MKKSICLSIFFLSAIVVVMNSCGTKKSIPGAEDVPHKIAYGYFPKTDSCMDCKPIKSEQEFNKYFAKTFTQNESTKPTPIDFSKEFVVAVVYPATNEKFNIGPRLMTIQPEKDTINVIYSFGEYSTKNTSIHKPTILDILDRKYIDYAFYSIMLGRASSGSPSITPYLEERSRLLIK